MTTKTLASVASKVNPYEKNGKTTYYVNVDFNDGSVGSIGKQNEAKAEEIRLMLVGLGRNPVEFGLEPNGTNNKGKEKFKIKSFPGYEPAPYEPGGKGGSWYNSEEGVRFTQDQMNRRTALMTAQSERNVLFETWVGVGGGPQNMPVAGWRSLADEMYAWLNDLASPTPSPGSGNQGHTNPGDATGAVGGTNLQPAPETLGGEGRHVGEGADPNPSTISRTELWANLVDYAGSQQGAVNLVNKECRKGYGVTNVDQIPESELLSTIATLGAG